MPIKPRPDAELAQLNKERDDVNVQMAAEWHQPSPDMGELESLHYELKNLDFKIATHEPEVDS
jgi:hypothetical protein